MKKIHIITLCIAILNLGCHSYFPVSNYDFEDTEGKIEIKLKNDSLIIVKNYNDIILNNDEKIIISTSDLNKITISKDEISQIRAESFDVKKTIFSSCWITGGVAALALVIYTAIYGPLKLTQ